MHRWGAGAVWIGYHSSLPLRHRVRADGIGTPVLTLVAGKFAPPWHGRIPETSPHRLRLPLKDTAHERTDLTLHFHFNGAGIQSMSIQSNAIEQVRRRLETQRSELRVRQGRVDRDLAHRNEPLVADSGDRAIQVQNDEPLQGIAEAAGQEIQAIDEALERLALGLYGVCRHCSKEISSARLEAVPYAVTCTFCRKD